MSRQDFAPQAAEPFDPYSAPLTSIKPVPTLGGGVAVPMTLNDVMARTWAVFRARPMLCIGVYAAGALLNFAGQFGITALLGMLGAATQNQGVITAMGLVAPLLTMIFGFWLTAGQTLALLNLAKGRPAALGNILGGTPYLLPMIVSSVLLGLAAAGVMMLGLAPGLAVMALTGMGAVEPLSVLVLGLGLLAGFLVISVYWVFFSQYFFVVVDQPELGAVGSLRESMRITRGRFWPISLVYLVTIGVNILGMLALLVGLIFSIPFTFLMLAVMYAALEGERPRVAL